MSLPLRFAPFALLPCPNLRLSAPSISISKERVFLAILASYVVIFSGAIYDVINEPPSIGAETDPITGAQRPVAVMKNRINGQFIIEGITAGMLYALAAVGVIAIDFGSRKTRWQLQGRTRFGVVVGGIAAVLVAYNVLMLFLRMKMPGYLS